MADERRRAFGHWLRTGRLPPPLGEDGRELKFNPYHDPDDGHFTSGPGAGGAEPDGTGDGSPETRDGNIRAFEDPMTLDQAFPGLASASGGAMFAVADNIFDITGPANEMQAEVLRRASAVLQAEVKQIDPRWHYDSLGPITTVNGLTSEVPLVINLIVQFATICVDGTVLCASSSLVQHLFE